MGKEITDKGPPRGEADIALAVAVFAAGKTKHPPRVGGTGAALWIDQNNQDTFARRLRQRMNAAPPASSAAAAQVPGSGTGEGPVPP